MKDETGTQGARYERFTWKPGDIIFGTPSTTAEAAPENPGPSTVDGDLVAIVDRLRRRLGVVAGPMGNEVSGIPQVAKWHWGKLHAQKLRNARLEAEVKRLRALLREAGKGTGR